MHCTYCGIPKGNTQAKVTLNSEKIKRLALAIVELCWSDGIREAISQLVSWLVVKNSVE